MTPGPALLMLTFSSLGSLSLRQASEPNVQVGAEVLVSDRPAWPHVEPYLVASPTDPCHLVAASIVSDPAARAIERRTVAVFTSSDCGDSWTHRPVPALDTLRFNGDPWLAWTADGTVLLSTMPAFMESGEQRVGIFLFRSADSGATWSGPVLLPESEFIDHPVLAHSPVSGQNVVHAAASKGRFGIGSFRSEDGGKTFAPPVTYEPDTLNNNVGSAVVLSDGTLILTYGNVKRTTSEPQRLWTLVSRDEGRTFGRYSLEQQWTPVSMTMLAADLHGPFRDRVYAVWIQGHRDIHVVVAYSADGGRTWSQLTRVSTRKTVPLTRSLPRIAVNREGVVGVAWEQLRVDDRSCRDTYFAASLDGGESFLPDVRVSSESSCPPNRTERDERNQYLVDAAKWWWGGDYSAIAAAADRAFHVVWSDYQSGVFQLRTARIVVGQ